MPTIMKPLLILINPWIYDFAAYDLWSKPLGLLHLASHLRRSGFRVHLIDCLDVHHPEMKETRAISRPVRRLYGTGRFWKENIPKPSPLKDIKRRYSRYGISRQLFKKALEGIQYPAAILVTSLMTYWYPGVQEVIHLVKETHPEVPVILGGIYARLCSQHAMRCSGADHVVTEGGSGAITSVLHILEEYGARPMPDARSSHSLTYPAFDLLRRIDAVSIQTSNGCPYKCHYCASPFLNPGFIRRDPDDVLEEILYWHRDYAVQDFAFYDDALLVGSETHMAVLLENLIRCRLNVRFHTPNALHVREVGPEIASLLFLSGFRTIRLGLETSDMELHQEVDKKVSEGEFESAVDSLIRAGFTRREIGAYVLTGLPGQSVDSAIDTIKFVDKAGATPYLAEYSPLPHTPLWENALSCSSHDLSEPLFHNNTLLPCWDEGQRSRVPELKKLVQSIRRRDA